jgi:hypothetical protein
MTEPIDLTPEQREFLGRACSFLRTKPPQQELDQLFTLATMLLPEPAVQMLKTRAAAGCSPFPDDSQLRRWLQ